VILFLLHLQQKLLLKKLNYFLYFLDYHMLHKELQCHQLLLLLDNLELKLVKLHQDLLVD
jgi:hypothetical protein